LIYFLKKINASGDKIITTNFVCKPPVEVRLLLYTECYVNYYGDGLIIRDDRYRLW